MIGPFFFVSVRSFKNRIVSRLRRLKQPRYLVSAIIGLAYFWFMGLRHLFSRPEKFAALTQFSDVGADIASIFVLVIMLFAWAAPKQTAVLEFTEAEMQFLFPAPVSRRQLILYKLLRGQIAVLISAAVMSLLIFRHANFFGAWASFVAISVYFMMVGLARARLKLMGIGWLIRTVAVFLVGLALVALFVRAFEAVPARQVAETMRHSRGEEAASRVVEAVSPAFEHPGIKAVLFVPKLFAAAALPPSKLQLLINIIGMIVVTVVCFELASRLNVSFEEASLDAAKKKVSLQEKMHQRRTGGLVTFKRMPPPFKLREGWAPEVAIFWKNMTAAMRISTAWMAILFVIMILIVFMAFSTEAKPIHIAAAFMAIMVSVTFPLFGPDVFTQDLRLDMPRMEMLKTYPIRGERLVMAEIATPVMMITAMEVLLLIGTSVMLNLVTDSKMGQIASPKFVVVALLFALPICAVQVLIRNGAAVLFPGWATRSKEEAKGFDVLGQRILMMVANLLLLIGALIPAAIVFLPSFLIAMRFFDGSQGALAIATVPAAALIALEVWLGIKFLGAQFEKIDVSNDVETVAV